MGADKDRRHGDLEMARQLGEICTSVSYIKEKVDETDGKVDKLVADTAVQGSQIEAHEKRMDAVEHKCAAVQQSKVSSGSAIDWMSKYRNTLAAATLSVTTIAAAIVAVVKIF
jgi:hypothetical protein